MNKLSIATCLILAIGIITYFSLNDSGQNDSMMDIDFDETSSITELESSAVTSQPVDVDEKPLIGYKAPPLSLTDYRTGEVYDIHQSDKPVVINFWASWCGPCHVEAPELVALNERFKDGVNLYTVNLSQVDQPDAMDQFVQLYNFEFPVLTDDDGSIGSAYQILAIPTTLFINSEGIIEHIIRGYEETSEDEVGELEYQYQKLYEQNNPSS